MKNLRELEGPDPMYNKTDLIIMFKHIGKAFVKSSPNLWWNSAILPIFHCFEHNWNMWKQKRRTRAVYTEKRTRWKKIVSSTRNGSEKWKLKLNAQKFIIFIIL